ncbi:MAG: hypothetical protein M1602_04685, partial [Firmicutes bacterium]|nr:hypothetical protein [Bacillota bacterium]
MPAATAPGPSPSLAEARQLWEEGAGKRPERRASFRTLSDVPVERLYTPLEANPDYLRDLGFPGEFRPAPP